MKQGTQTWLASPAVCRQMIHANRWERSLLRSFGSRSGAFARSRGRARSRRGRIRRGRGGVGRGRRRRAFIGGLSGFSRGRLVGRLRRGRIFTTATDERNAQTSDQQQSEQLLHDISSWKRTQNHSRSAGRSCISFKSGAVLAVFITRRVSEGFGIRGQTLAHAAGYEKTEILNVMIRLSQPYSRRFPKIFKIAGEIAPLRRNPGRSRRKHGRRRTFSPSCSPLVRISGIIRACSGSSS